MRGRLSVFATILVVALGLGAAPASSAETIVVHPGESIQAAIDRAEPGSEIIVRPGTYRENVTIQKHGIKLRGQEAKLRPPADPHPSVCEFEGNFPGICVVGSFEERPFVPVRNVEVSGFDIRNFPDSGVISFVVSGFFNHGNTFAGNAHYGAGQFRTTGLRLEDNRSFDNGFAGLYIGDTRNSGARITSNESFDNGALGIYMRDVEDGTAKNNILHGNCAGALYERAANWNFTGNSVTGNNRFCGGDPSFSGIGVMNASSDFIRITSNQITKNSSSRQADYQGGVVVATLFGDSPDHNVVSENFIIGNRPYDIFWDGTGEANVFTQNACQRSKPGSLCP